MNFQYLQYFKVVAKYQSLSEAANDLYLSQPYLSKVLNSLETELGVKLFNRIGRTIKLNEYGREYLKFANTVIRGQNEVEKKINQMKKKSCKEVKVALNIPSLMPLLLEKFVTRYDIVINNVNGSNSELRNMLETSEVDFCISSPPIEGENIEFIPLAVEELKLFLPPNHPFAGCKEEFLLSDFKDEPFLIFKKDFGIRDTLDEIFVEAGFQPDISYESEVNDLLINLVNLGMGVSLLPIHRWKDHKFQCNSVSISDPTCQRVIGLSYLKEKVFNETANQFQEHVLNFFEEQEQSTTVHEFSKI